MAEKILMIALSPTMETGTISSWLKQEGDDITSGDVICEVETDKATMDYEAVQEGTLLQILADEGASVAVGQPIGIIGDSGESIDDLVEEARKELQSSTSGKKKDRTKEETAKKEDATQHKTNGAKKDAEHIKSSPLARVLADKHGIDIGTLHGTGPDGRIVKRDVEKAVKRQGGEAEYAEQDKVRPVSQKRRVIAERLAESKFNAPHYYLKISVSLRNLLEARKSLNVSREKNNEEKVSLNAFLIKLSSEVLKRHPDVRSSWEGDSIRTFSSIDIGLAVAQPDGLITPVVKNCGGKGILQIDRELQDLITRAQTNKLSPEEYQGAVFTISNLGSFGIEEFTAIINPPGAAILAVGALQDQQILKMTLSCDHRVIDGAVGAHFLRDLKESMEQPITALY